jgi:copper transport protein
MVHVASMSVWLGGLVMLIVFLLPKVNATELGAIIPVWSRWASYAIGALLLTGLAQAIVLVGSVDALVTSTYGWLLLAKVALVLVIIAVANLSRRLVGPITDRATGAAPRLRMLIIIEASVAVVVLGVTSVLVQTTPANTASQSAPLIQSATMRTNLYTLSVDIDPGSSGANEIHMYANTPDGQPAVIEEWTVKASNPGLGIEAIDAAVLAFGTNHAVAQIGIPAGGTWHFTFTLRTTAIDEATASTDFNIHK